MSTSVFGKAGYEAYCRFTDNKSLVSGCELPKWEDLDKKIQGAWIAAATEITELWEVVSI